MGKCWFTLRQFVEIAIENDHRHSEFSHEKWWMISAAMLNYWRVSTKDGDFPEVCKRLHEGMFLNGCLVC